MLTMGELADLPNLTFGRQYLLVDAITNEKGTDGKIPPPDVNVRYPEIPQLLFGDEPHKRTMRQQSEFSFCLISMLHQNNIISLSPQCRNEAEVSPQLSAGMRGCIISQICSQSQVMLRVKNM